MPSFRNRIIGASAWVFGGHITGQALRLGGNLIMTRLLVPEMFGIMALANVLLIGLALFSDIGLGQNIIQSKSGKDVTFLDTAWTLQIIRSSFICLAGLLCALALAAANAEAWFPFDSAYADPILCKVMGILSLSSLVGGLNSTKLFTANRELTLGKVTIIELISQVSAIVIMVVWAYIDRSIWALVSGAFLGTLVKAILSQYLLPGPINRLHLNKEAFWELFHFGKWLYLTSIIGFLINCGDRLLIGGIVDSTTLGLYTIALFIVTAVQEMIAKIMSNVAFPVLCEVVRERISDLKSTYYKLRLPIDAITLFTAGLLFSTGTLIINTLYDERYLESGHLVEILSISLVGVRYFLADQCYIALGRVSLLVPLILTRLVFLLVLAPLVIKCWGFNAGVWVIACNILLALPLIIFFKIKYKLFDLKFELLVLPLFGVGYFLGLGLEKTVKLLV